MYSLLPLCPPTFSHNVLLLLYYKCFSNSSVNLGSPEAAVSLLYQEGHRKCVNISQTRCKLGFESSTCQPAEDMFEAVFFQAAKQRADERSPSYTHCIPPYTISLYYLSFKCFWKKQQCFEEEWGLPALLI